jgi:rRNA-processing protein FCF1
MQKKKVIIDTNFLMIPGQYKVDIFSEIERILSEPHELCIVEETIPELNRIVMSAGVKDKFAAKLALVLAIQKGLKRLPSSKGKVSADDEIVLESDENTYVATQDEGLRARVKEKGAKIIGLRQKRYLVVT